MHLTAYRCLVIGAALAGMTGAMLATEAVPQTAPDSVDWCVKPTVDYLLGGCNRATPDDDRLIGSGTAARAELQAQVNGLVAAGIVTKEDAAAEMSSLSLSLPATMRRGEWKFRTSRPGYYITIIAHRRSRG